MFITFLVEDILIPFLEWSINALVKLFQTKTFWILLVIFVGGVFTIHMLTGLSIREVLSVHNITSLWGLNESGAAESADTHDGASVPDKYRGGATPYDQ